MTRTRNQDCPKFLKVVLSDLSKPYLLSSYQTMLSDAGAPVAPMAKPQASVQKKKREWDRGCLMTPQKRADQPEFRGQMEVRGDQMWCIACHVPVNHLEKSYGSVHIATVRRCPAKFLERQFDKDSKNPLKSWKIKQGAKTGADLLITNNHELSRIITNNHEQNERVRSTNLWKTLVYRKTP